MNKPAYIENKDRPKCLRDEYVMAAMNLTIEVYQGEDKIKKIVDVLFAVADECMERRNYK